MKITKYFIMLTFIIAVLIMNTSEVFAAPTNITSDFPDVNFRKVIVTDVLGNRVDPITGNVASVDNYC